MSLKAYSRFRLYFLNGFLLMILFSWGCASTFRHPFTPEPARFGEFSNVYKKQITRLPEPKEKVYAAVYSFRDQTGQYKLSDNGANWSTAVTQGATSVLLQSLEESGWFTTIEREGLSNLLNERRIIRQTQEQYKGSGSALSPLLYAGIVIEGGIIAYESNIRTGGAGARYFGTGGSGEYREDQVTVYLRAVSTSSGRILKTVHASKTLLSQKLDVGIFRYVSLKKLLEAETGYTYNEPSFLAVQEAIDKAVLALIIEGVADQLWQLKDTAQLESSVISEYYAEKEEAYRTDYLGNVTVEKKEPLSIGADFAPVLYDGDLGSGKIKSYGSFGLGFFRNKPLQLLWSSGFGAPANNEDYSVKMATSSLLLHYDLFPNLAATPFVQGGYSALYQTGDKWFDQTPKWNDNVFQFVQVGAGYQWKIGDLPLFMRGAVNSQILLNDQLDDFSYGKYNDRLWYFSFGIEYRFNLSKKE